MLISGQNDQFEFGFPKELIPQHIEDRYMQVLERMPGNCFSHVIDFLNYSIQSVDFTLAPAGYTPNDQVDINTPWSRKHREASHPMGVMGRDMTVTFQLDSQYLIYFLLCDLWFYYYATFSEKFLPPGISFRIKDAYGVDMVRVKMSNVLLTGVSNLEFNFSNKDVNMKTMTATFTINEFEAEFVYRKDVNSDKYDDTFLI